MKVVLGSLVIQLNKSRAIPLPFGTYILRRLNFPNSPNKVSFISTFFLDFPLPLLNIGNNVPFSTLWKAIWMRDWVFLTRDLSLCHCDCDLVTRYGPQYYTRSSSRFGFSHRRAFASHASMSLLNARVLIVSFFTLFSPLCLSTADEIASLDSARSVLP